MTDLNFNLNQRKTSFGRLSLLRSFLHPPPHTLNPSPPFPSSLSIRLPTSPTKTRKRSSRELSLLFSYSNDSAWLYVVNNFMMAWLVSLKYKFIIFRLNWKSGNAKQCFDGDLTFSLSLSLVIKARRMFFFPFSGRLIFFFVDFFNFREVGSEISEIWYDN